MNSIYIKHKCGHIGEYTHEYIKYYMKYCGIDKENYEVAILLLGSFNCYKCGNR